jgi:hypothetical protein
VELTYNNSNWLASVLFRPTLVLEKSALTALQFMHSPFFAAAIHPVALVHSLARLQPPVETCKTVQSGGATLSNCPTLPQSHRLLATSCTPGRAAVADAGEVQGGSTSMREAVQNKDTCGRGGERVGKSRAGLSWGSIVVTRCWTPSRTLQQPWKETRSPECVCEKAVVQRTKIACCN